mgnify:CR=1 FL=1
MSTTTAAQRPAPGAARLAREVLGLFKLRIGVMIMITALVGLAGAPGPAPGALEVVVLALSVLASSVVLTSGEVYYLAVYNQVSSSTLGAIGAGFDTALGTPPINFRVQNISGFSVGDVLSLSDVSLQMTPWLAAY